MSQHKRLNIEEELYRDKRQRIATEHGKNVTSQLRQRKIMLRQGLAAGFQHQEEPVTTYKLLSRHWKQEESINSVATRYLMSQQERAIQEEYFDISVYVST